MHEQTSIQKADPKARRKAIVWVSMAGLVLGMLMAYFSSHEAAFQSWVVSHGEELVRSPGLAAGFMSLLMLPVVVGALVAFRYAERVKSDRRFPPLNTKVVRDTPVLLDEQALRRAWGIQALAYCLFAGVCIIVYLTWRLFESLGAAG